MSHTVHPYAHRLGIIRDWKSRWFGAKDSYREFLRGDVLLRRYLTKKLRSNYISSIEMERDSKTFKLILKTSRPGMLIGKNGEGVQALRKDILRFMRKNRIDVPADVRVDIEEVKSPESDAAIVGMMIAEQLEKRMPFRRVIKQTVEKVMANRDVKGVRVTLAGRLGGAEMARKEEVRRGNIPLQTFRADVDFSREKAYLTYGVIGIKVWIYKGEIFN